MKILKYFIKVCEEHNLTYFLYGGSLIRAIRHQGFIPMMTILMLSFSEDFEKLNKFFEKEIDNKYRFFNVLNEETHYYT